MTSEIRCRKLGNLNWRNKVTINSEDKALELKEIRDELQSIKRLLMVLLVKLGATSDELGIGLQLSGGRVRQLITMSKISPIVGNKENTEG